MLPCRRLMWLLSRILFVAFSAAAEFDWDQYERGLLGSDVKATFHTSRLAAPYVHVTKNHTGCDATAKTLLAPQGEGFRGNQAFIYDAEGRLMWTHEERGVIKSMEVQEYKGSRYLTYWVGDDDFWGHGHGYYKMLDETYAPAFTVSGGFTAGADFHEFTITPQNTALVTAYVKTAWDLTNRDRQDGFIWDCVFREVDVETDEVLFEWKASDHFAFEDLAVNSWEVWTGRADDPWDWFHLNSVSKDRLGNYLVTARFTQAVTYINGTDGTIIWNLGGKHNGFADHASNNATRFTDPHNARWNGDQTAVTLFDNVAYWSKGVGRPHPRAAVVHLDTKHMAADLRMDLVHPDRFPAWQEGSVQELNNGNYFVGYGSASVFAEFHPNGTMLCAANYAPLHTDAGKLKPDLMNSYRIYKQQWRGHPRQRPNVVLSRDRLYVSWNGATQNVAWRLEERRRRERGLTSWKAVGTFPIMSYETEIPLETGFVDLQLTALDTADQPILSWYIETSGILHERWRDPPSTGASDAFIWWVAVCSCLFGLVWNNRRRLG